MNESQLATLPADHFDGRLDEIVKVVPGGDKAMAQMLARVVLTALNKTPELRNCTPASILGCMFDLAAIGLVPNTPQQFAFLIPYGGKCTLQIGYRGFCKLAYDSNQVKIIKAGVVREGDKFEYAKGTADCFVRHSEQLGRGRDKQPLIGAWASVELLNGGVTVEVMDADELDKIMKLSKSPASKIWGDEFRKKSVVKRMLKLLQIGGMTMVHKAIEIDNKSPLPEPPKPHTITFEDSEPAALTDEEPQPATIEEGERDAATGEYLF